MQRPRATRYIPSMSFSDLFILCIKCHWADYRHSGPVLMLISPTTDGVMPAIHHFPRILYHAAWWMQTNRSDFHSAISLLYPTSPPPPQNPHIYQSPVTPLSLSSNPLAHCAQLNHDPRFPLFILHVQPSAHSLSLAVASSSLLFHLHDLTPTPTINTTDGQRESTTCRPAHCHIIFASGL